MSCVGLILYASLMVSKFYFFKYDIPVVARHVAKNFEIHFEMIR